MQSDTIWNIWIGPGEPPEKYRQYLDTWKILEDEGCHIVNIGNDVIGTIRSERQSICLDWAEENKKWCVLGHYIRYWLLWKYGGIYMDMDVQVIRPFTFRDPDVLYVGMESERWINNHVMIAPADQYIFEDALEAMDDIELLTKPEPELNTGPRLISNLIYENTQFKYRFLMEPTKVDYGADKICIMPEKYFSGHRWYQKFDPSEITKDTYTIHHYGHSWKGQ